MQATLPRGIPYSHSSVLIVVIQRDGTGEPQLCLLHEHVGVLLPRAPHKKKNDVFDTSNGRCMVAMAIFFLLYKAEIKRKPW